MYLPVPRSSTDAGIAAGVFEDVPGARKTLEIVPETASPPVA
jgi:hypothetical protein